MIDISVGIKRRQFGGMTISIAEYMSNPAYDGVAQIGSLYLGEMSMRQSICEKHSLSNSIRPIFWSKTNIK